MAKVEEVSIALTPEMAATMRQAVNTGEYASMNEVMCEALQEWELRRLHRAQALEELGHLWDEGLASGEAVESKQVFERIRAKLDSNHPV